MEYRNRVFSVVHLVVYWRDGRQGVHIQLDFTGIPTAIITSALTIIAGRIKTTKNKESSLFTWTSVKNRRIYKFYSIEGIHTFKIGLSIYFSLSPGEGNILDVRRTVMVFLAFELLMVNKLVKCTVSYFPACYVGNQPARYTILLCDHHSTSTYFI